MKRKKSTKGLERARSFITSPGFFIAAGLFYLAISTYAASDPDMAAINPIVSISALSVLVFLFGLASYNLGLRMSKPALKLGYIPLAAGLSLGIAAAYYILNLSLIAAVAMNVFVVLLSYVLLFSRLRYEYLFAAGTFLFWLNFAINGMPFLDMGMHNDLFLVVNPLFIMGFFFMIYSLARLHPKRRFLWIFLIFSVTLATYRVYVGVAFLTWLFLELRLCDWSRRTALKLGTVLAGLLVICALFVVMGHSMMTDKFGFWQADPISTFEYRLAFTFGVFDDIVRLSYPLGLTHGASLQMESTQYTCAVLYGCSDRITSTAFGEAMLDFGLLGVFAVSVWAAVVLANLHRKDFGLYAILFSSLIASLDVGINVFLILLYAYMGWMRVIVK